METLKADYITGAAKHAQLNANHIMLHFSWPFVSILYVAIRCAFTFASSVLINSEHELQTVLHP